MSRKASFALIGAALYLFVSGWFVANLETRAELRAVATRPEFQPAMTATSAFFMIALALPSFVALCKWQGVKRGFLIIGVLSAFAFTIETIGLNTGLPYGRFEYGAAIGGKLPGGVPWTVPFGWTPLVLGATFLARRHADHLRAFAVRGALWLVAFDLVLDPGAVAQKFWRYLDGGAFHDVPASNFAGWFFSGLIGMTLVWNLTKLRADTQLPRGLLISAWLTMVFWTSVLLWRGLVAPTIIGVVLWAWLGRALFAERNARNEPDASQSRREEPHLATS